jgi:uncharacterized protein (TIGR03083 family)
MVKPDVWPTAHAERQALATDLQGLTPEQWVTPSLCHGWTVRDVLAHMTATAKLTPVTFFGSMIRSRFSLTRLQAAAIEVEKGDTTADTLERFEAQVTSTRHPPGPLASWLGEVLVHAEDIRRPLSIRHDYPLDAAVVVAEFYTGSNLIIGAKKRITGIRLRATDTDWTHGDGPEVAGPIMSVVLAMTGRTVVLDELTGEGVSILRARA